jgi:hypothetical protein
MRLSKILQIVDQKVKEENLPFWTFDHYKTYAQLLLENLGFVTIPLRLSKSAKEEGKLEKRPAVEWKNLKPETWEELEIIWELAVAKKGKRDLVREGKFDETTRDYKKEFSTTGIAVLTGKLSGITVIDIDNLELFKNKLPLTEEEWNSLRNSTLVIRTPSGGYHLYFKYNPELPTTVNQANGFDVRNDKALVVLPPSRLPESLTPAYTVDNDAEIKEIPEWFLQRLLKRIRTATQKHTPNNPVNVSETRKKELSDRDIKAIVDLFAPIWVSGHRHNLTLYLAGILYKAGVPLWQAKEIIAEITTVAGDEEQDHRLYIVEYTYTERAEELKEEGKDLKGISGLEEELDQLVQRGILTESGAYNILEQLQTLLEIKKEKEAPLFVLTSYQPPAGFASIPRKKAIVEWRKKDGVLQITRKIINASLSEVEVIYDPEDNQRYFLITLECPTKTKVTIEGTQQQIVEEIVEKGLHSADKRKVDIAIANLLTGYEQKGLAKVYTKPKYKGFFIYNNELVVNWDFLDKVKHLPEEEVNRNIITALKFLNGHVEVYGQKKKNELSTVIKFALTSPFFYIRKTHGNAQPFQWLFLVGVKDTGKTRDATLVASFWGEEPKFLTKSEIIRIPSFTTSISKSTFAVIADETAGLFPRDRENAAHIADVSEYLRK